MASFKFVAGRWVRADVRSFLLEFQFSHDGLTFTEDKGFFDSTFYVRGPLESVAVLAQIIQKLSNA